VGVGVLCKQPQAGLCFAVAQLPGCCSPRTAHALIGRGRADGRARAHERIAGHGRWFG
jgi:hypothetical protein